MKFASVSRHALIGGMAAAMVLSHSSAFAQDAAAAPAADEQQGISDIVVTAEKRSTSLQRTPLAVTALDGETLARSQITDLRNLGAIVPSFKAAETGGFAQITIRGIGIQNFVPLAESAVAVNLNEVYLSRPVSFLSSMFDVGSIEVLRGPQGTLYGRNATAGSVNMTSVRPGDELSGFVRLVAGNYRNLKGEAAIGGPIVPGLLAVRVAGFAEVRDGYGKNVTTGTDIDDKRAQAIRGTVVLTPAEDLKITGIAEYYHENDNNGGYHYFGGAGTLGVSGTFGSPPFATLFGGTVLPNSYDVANDFDPRFRLKVTTLTGIVDYKIGAFGIKSITGYRDQKLNLQTDLDGSNLPLGIFVAGEPAHQFSQELQLNYDSDRLHLTVGAYYFREKDSFAPAIAAFSSTVTDPILAGVGIVLPPRPPVFLNFVNLGGTIWTRSRAAFAQGSYELADGLSLIAGIRFSKDRKRLEQRYQIDLFTPYDPNLPLPAGVAVAPRSFSSTTPKLGVQYQATPNTLVFATYSKGFKAGSFDPGADPATTPEPSFKPEKLTSYEMGLKTTLLDRRLRANVAAFYYDYTDLQVSQTRGLGIVTQNAGKARVYGLEAEVTVLPVPELEIGLNGSYLDAKYTDYVGADAGRPLLPAVDFGGNRLNNAPEWSGSASVQYTIPMGNNALVLRGEGEFTSKVYFTPGNYDLVGQSGYAKANAYITYRFDSGLSVTGYVRNLTDKKVRNSGLIETPFLGTPAQGSFAPPRTYGIDITYRL